MKIFLALAIFLVSTGTFAETCSMQTYASSWMATGTPFSEFIRKASAEEKKRVYSDVLKRASDAQNKVVDKSHPCKATG